MSRMRTGAGNLLIPLSAFSSLVAVWEHIVRLLNIPSYLLPAPTQIFHVFTKTGGELILHVGVTLQEVLLGFVIGSGVGMLLGIAIAYSRILARVIYPMAIFIKVIPIVAIAPLLVIWFGFGIWSKVAVTIIISFFPLVVSTAIGLRSVNEELIYLMNSLSATELQLFLKVKLPWSLPHVFSALKVAITLSVIGAIVGEFVGANIGLGYLITMAVSFIDTAAVFAILIVLAIMGVSLFGMIVLIERIVAPWTTRGQSVL